MSGDPNAAVRRQAVARHGELAAGDRRIVEVDGMSIGLFFIDGVYHAYRNVCPHAGAPVCAGRLAGTTLISPVYQYRYGREGQILRCPWHGWEFDIVTGCHLVDSAVKLKRYAVEVVDGAVFVVTRSASAGTAAGPS